PASGADPRAWGEGEGASAEVDGVPHHTVDAVLDAPRRREGVHREPTAADPEGAHRDRDQPRAGDEEGVPEQRYVESGKGHELLGGTNPEHCPDREQRDEEEP